VAGEPESLSTDEPLSERVARHEYDRLIMLSDGVFAIAITLLALEMKIPEEWDGSFPSLIRGAGRPLVGYVFGFLLVGAFWIAHRRLFAKLARVDRVVTLLNIALLGFIGLAPFVARLIAEKGPTRSMPTYLLLTGVIFATYAATYTYGGVRKLLHPEIDRKRWARESLGLSLGAAVILGGGLAAALFNVAVQPPLLVVLALASSFIARGIPGRRG
jgi:uncharacterized membrane protein